MGALAKHLDVPTDTFVHNLEEPLSLVQMTDHDLDGVDTTQYAAFLAPQPESFETRVYRST